MENTNYQDLIEVTHDKVAILPFEAVSQTSWGLIIPESAQNPPMEGIVIATGPGTHLSTGICVPVQYGVGDHVVYGKYGGIDVRRVGKDAEGKHVVRKFIVLSEKDVICRLPPMADEESTWDEEGQYVGAVGTAPSTPTFSIDPSPEAIEDFKQRHGFKDGEREAKKEYSV